MAVQHYKNRYASYLERIKTTFLGLFLAALCTSMFLYMTKSGQDFSRMWLGLTVIISFFLILSCSSLISIVIQSSIGSKKIIILGSNDTANLIKKKLNDSDQNWLSIVAEYLVFKDSGSEIIDFIESHRMQSKINAISEIWITHDIFSAISITELHLAFNRCSVTLVFIPEVPEPILYDSDIEYILGIPTIDSQLTDSNRANKTVKYIEDKIISVALLVILSPLMLIIAILIKFDSKGPIIYWQNRYGAQGQEFKIAKFRTMHTEDSDENFSQATENDPRVTKVGSILRKRSLDELPQLINVIYGNMSLVGPRPHPNLLNERYRNSIYSYMKRHNIKPGITGLAQINGARGETKNQEDMVKRLKYDMEYIRNWSIYLDLKIMLLTVVHLITNQKSY